MRKHRYSELKKRRVVPLNALVYFEGILKAMNSNNCNIWLSLDLYTDDMLHNTHYFDGGSYVDIYLNYTVDGSFYLGFKGNSTAVLVERIFLEQKSLINVKGLYQEYMNQIKDLERVLEACGLRMDMHFTNRGYTLNLKIGRF